MKLSTVKTVVYVILTPVILMLLLYLLTSVAVFAIIAAAFLGIGIVFELIFWHCPACGKFIGPLGNKHCPSCGEKLDA